MSFKNLSLYVAWQRIFSQPCIVSFMLLLYKSCHLLTPWCFPLAVTSWWSSFHKIWQQSNCSSWLGFSGDSIPPHYFFFLYFCLELQQIFPFLSWHFHSFIVYMGVCGSFIYVWKGKFSISMHFLNVILLLFYASECYVSKQRKCVLAGFFFSVDDWRYHNFIYFYCLALF